jgi:predicted MFS family arabinose efflux permease
MEIEQLLMTLGGGGVCGTILTGVIKNRVKVATEFRPLIALVTGSLAGLGISFFPDAGISLTEIVTAVVAGIVAVGGREQLKAVFNLLRQLGVRGTE